MTQTVILRSQSQRSLAKQMIDKAGQDYVVTISEPKRNADQNALMWAMISDISRAKPKGRRHTPDLWKAIFMKACGHHVQFCEGLDGEPFPVGFRSSNLNKQQMSDLIEFIRAYAAEQDIAFSNEYREAA